MQFGRNLELSPNMKCSAMKGNVFVDSHSHQIDYSSQLSLSKFFLIEEELRSNLDVYLIDFGEKYNIIVPEKKIQSGPTIKALNALYHFGLVQNFQHLPFVLLFI